MGVDSALKSVPGQGGLELQHLRRFAKRPFLPTWLQEKKDNGTPSPGRKEKNIDSERRRPSSSDSQSDSSQRSSSSRRPPRAAFMLLCPTTIISEKELVAHIKTRVPSLFEKENDPICSAEHNKSFKMLTRRVPLFPPPTLEIASELSRTVWPTIFNPNTTYGPNPTDLARVQSKLQECSGRYMDLAGEVAQQCYQRGFGVKSGAVVVERCTVEGKEVERIVCVAGDGRYLSRCSSESSEEILNSSHSHKQVGNPAGHAVMRAISIVAAKRRLLASHSSTSPETSILKLSSVVPPVDVVFLEDPLLPLEEQHNPRQDNLTPNGYLCLDLEIYLTHEPCVMCCMALNHSRFGRVIFEREMPATGGLLAERRVGARSEGYGLFWRDELTWRILTWQWKGGDLTTEEHMGNLSVEESADVREKISM